MGFRGSGGPHNKNYSISGSTLGSPYFGKLPSAYSQAPSRSVAVSGMPQLIPMDFVVTLGLGFRV